MRARIFFLFEILIFSALILITRCANYRDVFANRKINFVDADCYARMTRARICFEHPGTIIRHHDFENFPAGTSPHTTAPLDYLIVALAALLMPFSRDALEFAGAIVSPFIAVALGIFLCWWTRRIGMRFRFALLALYAISPILAHGTALGRPDHQSLLIALVAVALCADWMLHLEGRVLRDRAASQSSPLQHSVRGWNSLSGTSWGLAIWVSLYEPAILLAISAATCIAENFARGGVQRERIVPQRGKWLAFLTVIVAAAVIERRVPSLVDLQAFENWSGTIGELRRVPLTSAIWFEWCGWLVLLTPLLFWPKRRDRRAPAFLIALLVVTFALTMMQARWGYFFVLIFALLAPEILSVIRKPLIATAIFGITLLPVAQAWDITMSDRLSAIRAENQIEQMELRSIASDIDGPLLAPWWFSPALAYWSQQPAVAGSSHESLSGTVDCALFYAAIEPKPAADICRQRRVKWVVAYDSDRIVENSARILARPVADSALCHVLDRHPSAVPAFLKLVRQTARFKLYRVEGL